MVSIARKVGSRKEDVRGQGEGGFRLTVIRPGVCCGSQFQCLGGVFCDKRNIRSPMGKVSKVRLMRQMHKRKSLYGNHTNDSSPKFNEVKNEGYYFLY